MGAVFGASMALSLRVHAEALLRVLPRDILVEVNDGKAVSFVSSRQPQRYLSRPKQSCTSEWGATKIFMCTCRVVLCDNAGGRERLGSKRPCICLINTS